MGNYQRLTVWKQAHGLVLEVYRSTKNFPVSERYGLTAQLRRAAISVVANIAEGSGRQSDGDQARFLRIARGSACEMESQLLISRDLGYIKDDAWKLLDDECQQLSKMLNGLIRALRRGSGSQ